MSLRRAAVGLLGASVAMTLGGSPAQAAAADRFEQLRRDDQRVASVAYRLATADPSRCHAKPTPQPGFLLHTLAQYAPDDRPGAATSFGLSDGVAVEAVVPGSAAEHAGLAEDERLISVNGIPLIATVTAAPGRGAVDEAERVLAAEMAKGPAVLRVAGTHGERDVRFDAAPGCSSRVELVLASDVNAWADGARVMITTATLARCGTDDELALVLAHEMAHNILRHRQRLGAAAASRDLLPVNAAGSAAMRETEEEADRFAVGMMAAAGYDLRQAPPFLARMLEANDPSARASATHPGSVRRLALLKADIAAVQPAAVPAHSRARTPGKTSATARASGRI